MKPKFMFKITVDILMTAALLFLVGYQFWEEAVHEWGGAGMFFLFILHHLLNKNWHLSLLKGKYSPARVLLPATNLLVFLSIAGLMVSAVILSNHVFTFLHLQGGTSFARLLHMVSAYWGFVLMAVHLGLHWGIFLATARRLLKLKQPSRLRKILLSSLGTGIAAWGLFAFLRRDLPTYMFLQTEFVFLDFNEPILFFYLDYLAMMGTFIFLGYYGSRLLKK